jgi:hypothetical protein
VRAGLAGVAAMGLPAVLGACDVATVIRLPRPTPTPNLFGTSWEPAIRQGIRMGESTTGPKWNAGRVNDILELTPASILVASQSSGVWLLTTGSGVALSRDWPDTWMNTLAAAPDPSHANRLRVFAGGSLSSYTQHSGALYMTDMSAEAPLFAPWLRIDVSGLGIGVIHDILLLGDLQSSTPRNILLATDTGLFWSRISDDPHDFSWNSPDGAPPSSCGFWSLAAAPLHGFVAGAFGNNPAANHFGIYVGGWALSPATSSSRLTMRRATMTGFDVTQMGTTSVASCASDPRVMYAICAQVPPPNTPSGEGNSAGSPYVVLRSSPSSEGSQWTGATPILRTPLRPMVTGIQGEAGDQGNDHNNCIAVAPDDPNVVAFGWITGPFISVDGARTFYEMQRESTHDDKDVIVFTQTDHERRMYLGCDGGVALARHLERLAVPVAPTQLIPWNWDYSYSAWLGNLQFTGPSFKWQWWGRLGVTGITIGGKPAHLIGGGTQDNNDVYGITWVNGASQPWKPVTGGEFDGGWVVFPPFGGALHADAGLEAHYSQWDGVRAAFANDQAIPIRAGSHSTQPTLHAIIELIPSPPAPNAAGQLLFALGANGPDVWGLYGGPPGSDLHWEYLFSVPKRESILSLASTHGTIVYVGTGGSGIIYRADLSARPIRPIPSTGIPAGAVARIVMDPNQDTHAYAILNDTAGMTNNGVYVAINETPTENVWKQLPGLPPTVYYCLDARWQEPGPHLFVGTDDAVWGSANGGTTWRTISDGLPRTPHCSDLVYFHDQTSDKHYLYLSTFGWSVWRAELHDPRL